VSCRSSIAVKTAFTLFGIVVASREVQRAELRRGRTFPPTSQRPPLREGRRDPEFFPEPVQARSRASSSVACSCQLARVTRPDRALLPADQDVFPARSSPRPPRQNLGNYRPKQRFGLPYTALSTAVPKSDAGAPVDHNSESQNG
jgi:hypothetical protein